jgi:UDP-GlcNAc3NAcA epimerase
MEEVLIHTGQHYDKNMSEVFFSELELREPNYDLGISQASHGKMTGQMLIAVEETLEIERPEIVLVYGDTNSTLAGALAASKLNIPVVHVEAGLRSFNRRMPEEVNRVVTDHVSSLLFCPTATAVNNLGNEGIQSNVHLVGDVMYDATLLYRETARARVDLSKWGVTENDYVLCTIHRAENTDERSRFTSIMVALKNIATEYLVVFPVHPRTRKLLESDKELMEIDNIIFTEPVSYLEMLCLESSAKAILTDSGGMQKEAYFQGRPCITLRDETEWVETVETGVNRLCGANEEMIASAWRKIQNASISFPRNLYGDGTSATKIVDVMFDYLTQLQTS